MLGHGLNDDHWDFCHNTGITADQIGNPDRHLPFFLTVLNCAMSLNLVGNLHFEKRLHAVVSWYL